MNFSEATLAMLEGKKVYLPKETWCHDEYLYIKNNKICYGKPIAGTHWAARSSIVDKYIQSNEWRICGELTFKELLPGDKFKSLVPDGTKGKIFYKLPPLEFSNGITNALEYYNQNRWEFEPDELVEKVD